LEVPFDLGDGRGSGSRLARPVDRKQTAGLENDKAPHLCASATNQPRGCIKRTGGAPCIQAGDIRRGGKRAFLRKCIILQVLRGPTSNKATFPASCEEHHYWGSRRGMGFQRQTRPGAEQTYRKKSQTCFDPAGPYMIGCAAAAHRRHEGVHPWDID
jgi:hypothetical protein